MKPNQGAGDAILVEIPDNVKMIAMLETNGAVVDKTREVTEKHFRAHADLCLKRPKSVAQTPQPKSIKPCQRKRISKRATFDRMSKQFSVYFLEQSFPLYKFGMPFRR